MVFFEHEPFFLLLTVILLFNVCPNPSYCLPIDIELIGKLIDLNMSWFAFFI